MTENDTPQKGTSPEDQPGVTGQQHHTEPLPRMHYRPIPAPPGQPGMPGHPGRSGQPGGPGNSHSQGAPTQRFPIPPGWAQHGPRQQGQAHPPSSPSDPRSPAQQVHAGNPQGPSRRTWPAVVGTAAITALLVGGGTAVGTVAFLNQDNPPAASGSIDRLGQNSKISVTSVDDANWESVASDVAPSVVAIGVRMQRGEAEGSGVILDSAGHILTNDHVVSGAVNDEVQVTSSDGRLFGAKIVGLDPSTDLAVIKLIDPPSDLVSAAFADSGKVIVGNAVMAVGNPLGLANTVTTGIVSAVARPVSAASEGNANDVVVTNAIQIDAAINPGNSGGPLFNTSGEVIGITSSIASLSQGSGAKAGSIGLGFAIPANLASSVGAQLIDKGTAEHAFLGVSLSDGTGAADGVTRRGAKIESVTPDSPAAGAGIRTGDVVVAFNGQPVNGAESLTAWVRELVSGDGATVTLVRGGSTMDIDVTLAANVDDAQSRPGRQDQQDEQDEQDQQDPRPGNDNPSNIPGDFFDWLLEQRGF